MVKVKYSLQRQAHSSGPLGALVHEVRRVNHDGPGVENFHLLVQRFDPAGSSSGMVQNECMPAIYSHRNAEHSPGSLV